jgi:hypothetical protein
MSNTATKSDKPASILERHRQAAKGPTKTTVKFTDDEIAYTETVAGMPLGKSKGELAEVFRSGATVKSNLVFPHGGRTRMDNVDGNVIAQIVEDVL